MAQPRLGDDEVRDGLARLPGWTRDGDKIVKVYELGSFMDAIELVRRIAALAEAANHHPDLDIRYRKVRVALSTHDAGGLTALDLSLASQIDDTAGGGAA
jgi:4a-hydroxytetrahydrobiopterin dehydratase